MDWYLQPGELVVFDYRYFVGASKHIKLYSRISFRFDTLLFGRFIFAMAEAPADRSAHLLLAVESLDLDSVRDNSTDTAMIERVVAWQARTCFQATITPKMSSVYLDPFSLFRITERDQAPGRVLVDTRPVKVGFFGIFRYALRALSPL